MWEGFQKGLLDEWLRDLVEEDRDYLQVAKGFQSVTFFMLAEDIITLAKRMEKFINPNK